MKTASLQFNLEGVPYSGEFDDIYYSSDGGLGQVRHVFMAGNGLPARWQGHETFTILETGFGLGLNFLATWQAWKNDPARSQRLHFVSVEKFPFSAADLAQLQRQWPELADLSAQLIAQWPWLIPGFHRLEFDGGRVVLTLLLGDALECLPKLRARVDAIYLDGFAPNKNPDMWSPRLFKLLWRLSHAHTTLASYTVAGHVRRGLTEAGFAVARIKGFGGKRQMLTGQTARQARPLFDPPESPKQAIVIGAGLAGTGVAERLAARGWRITILEASDRIAAGASGNHAGLLHPALSLDDNFLTRLTRAGFAGTLAHLQTLQATGLAPDYGDRGVLQIAGDAREAARMAQITSHQKLPENFVEYLSAASAQERLGMASRHGGYWFARGSWVNPASLCRANLARWPDLITVRFNTTVCQLQKNGALWQLFDAHGTLLASSPVVILANATAATQLIPAAKLPLSDSPRCVTRLPASAQPSPEFSLTGIGYFTAAYQGWRCAGAAEVADADLTRGEAHNLNELGKLFANWQRPPKLETHTRLCQRPNSADRLPLIGAIPAPADPALPMYQLDHVPRYEGLYGVLGFGARGLSWTWLAGEILAAQLHAEPLPISTDLLGAIDPARFILRQARRSATP